MDKPIPEAVELLRAFQSQFGARRPDEDEDDAETWDRIDAVCKALTAALTQQPDDIASGGCTTNGADVWCNGHIVATARGLTLAPYRAARIAACLNACAGIEDPVAFIQRAKEKCCGEEKRGPLAHSRNVIRQSLHWHGVPVHVTGTITTSPGNWSLIDAALATQQREPKP